MNSMENLFYNNDDSSNLKINMDELYQEKQKKDLTKVETYNKLLSRIHVKIKTVSRQRHNNQWCWFLMPEVLIGAPKYDFSDCLSYLMYKLQDNGFVVKYTHPNLLFISWKHWVPSYVRTELKKKTGLVIDEFGNKISKKTQEEDNIDSLLHKKSNNQSKERSKFKSINSYKPSGNSVYNMDLMNKLKSTLEN